MRTKCLIGYPAALLMAALLIAGCASRCCPNEESPACGAPPAPTNYTVNVDVCEVDGHFVTNECRVKLGWYTTNYSEMKTTWTGQVSIKLPSSAKWWGIYAAGTNNHGTNFCRAMQQSNLLDNVYVKIILDRCP